jgi:hypothetical protein
MIRRNVIGIASTVVLLAVTACGDDGNGNGGDDDGDGAVVGDAGRDASGDAAGSDAGDSGARDSGGGSPEAGTPDASVTPDGGDIDAAMPSDGGGMDAARDAEAGAPSDAATPTDAAPDAAADAAADAASLDAAMDGAADAAADAAVDSGLPVLAARYAFNENTGTTAADTAGAFSAAMLLNGASWTTGKQGSALDLAGGATNQHVALPANILEGCNDITIAMWMRLGSTPAWARLLDIDGTVDGFLFWTPTQDISGVPHMRFNIFHPPGMGADDQGVSAPYPAGTVLVNTWHHVAFTLSGGTGRLYFNGVQVGSNAMTTKPSDLTIGATAHAWLGRSTFASDAYLDASIDDLRISCTAYSAEQVAALAQ